MPTDDHLSWSDKYSLISGAFYNDALLLTPEYVSIVESLTPGELACFVLQVTLEGREKTARDLMQIRGPVTIEYQKGRNQHDIGTVNGQAFAYSNYDVLKTITTVDGLKSLLKMAEEFGMKGLIEPGDTFPLFFTERAGFSVAHQAKFSGELPFLDAGLLKQPELMIAMLDESQRSQIPMAYQPVLCWATKDMTKQFPSQLAPVTPFQDIDNNRSVAEWLVQTSDPRQMIFNTIVMGCRPTEGSTSNVGSLFGYMAPESSRYGFSDVHGRVLCETTVNFLQAFTTGPAEASNFMAAKAFVEGYFPMDIINAQVAKACADHFGHELRQRDTTCLMQGRHSSGFSGLFALLSKDHPLRDQALSMMPPEMWHKLLLKTKGDFVYPESLMAMYETFGIDNTGLTLKITSSRLMSLLGSGYRFSDKTEVLEDFESADSLSLDDYDFEEEEKEPTSVFLSFQSTDFMKSVIGDNATLHRDVLDGYIEVLKLNLWPVTNEKPTDVGHALKMSVGQRFNRSDNKLVMSLKAYLAIAGVEACVKAAITPDNWEKICETFSSDELTPYLSLMPKITKGRFLESVMGL